MDEREDEGRTAVVTEVEDETWSAGSSSCPVGRRRRGPALLQAIHSAALAQLAEHGLGALTMESVATWRGNAKAAYTIIHDDVWHKNLAR